MSDTDLLNDYQEFVDEVSSDATKNLDDFIEALEIIDEQGVEVSRLLHLQLDLLENQVSSTSFAKRPCFKAEKWMKIQ